MTGYNVGGYGVRNYNLGEVKGCDRGKSSEVKLSLKTSARDKLFETKRVRQIVCNHACGTNCLKPN